MKDKWVINNKFCCEFLKGSYVCYEIDEIAKKKIDLFFVDFKQKVEPFIPKELQGEGAGLSGNNGVFLYALVLQLLGGKRNEDIFDKIEF